MYTKTWIIVRKEDLEVVGHYASDIKDDTSKNRSYLMAEPLCVHVELQDEIDPALVKCEEEDGHMVLSLDSAKLAAKEAATWARVRAERDERLLASDKYLLADFPISGPNLVAIKAYRQELRDLPEEYNDADDVEWPEFPL